MAQTQAPSTAGHLPKQGGDTTPGPPEQLPRQRRGTTPQMRGRYPDYDVLTAASHWDARVSLTAAAVEDLIMRDIPMLACELSWLALFVTGLYQTGGTTHPGGSITGAPGRNTAMVMLEDLATDC